MEEGLRLSQEAEVLRRGEVRGPAALLIWCQRVTQAYYPYVNITNMSSCWRNGLAFCALIHHFRPSLLDFRSLRPENVFENNRLAYQLAEDELGIPSLLDPEDMEDCRVPDKFSVITYVAQFYHRLKDEDNSRLGNPIAGLIQNSPHDNSDASAAA